MSRPSAASPAAPPLNIVEDGDAPAEVRDRNTDMAVGMRLRHLRKARGKSLKDIASAAGLSVGYVSQVERGLSSASVRVLARLADALEVGIGDLFGGDDDGSDTAGRIVARVRDRRRIDLPGTGAVKELITPFDQTPRLDIYMVILDPGGSSGDEPYVHDGEEAGVVLQGGLELEVDGRRYVLGEGDSFRFASSRPHRFRNASAREAQVIWINYRD